MELERVGPIYRTSPQKAPGLKTGVAVGSGAARILGVPFERGFTLVDFNDLFNLSGVAINE